MKEFTCKKCGSNDLVKEDGLYVCQHCGTKYKPDKKDPLFSFSFTVSEGDGDTDETEEKVHIGAYVAQVINVLWVALKEFIKECVNFYLKCLLCLLIILSAYLIYYYYLREPLDIKSASLDSAKAAQIVIPADNLQRLFLELNTDITVEEVESAVKKYDLKLAKMEFENTSTTKGELCYKIGKTDNSVKFSTDHPEESINIYFDKGNNNRFMLAAYFNIKYYPTSALLYSYGHFNAFREIVSSENTDKPGFYYYNYELSYEKNPPYIKCSDGKEALLRMFAFKRFR